MKAPDVIYGPSAQTLWHESPVNGDLLIDPMTGGDPMACVKDADGTYHFHHDTLFALGTSGQISDCVRDGKRNFLSFRIGMVPFVVVDHRISDDIYRCITNHRTQRS